MDKYDDTALRERNKDMNKLTLNGKNYELDDELVAAWKVYFGVEEGK